MPLVSTNRTIRTPAGKARDQVGDFIEDLYDITRVDRQFMDCSIPGSKLCTLGTIGPGAGVIPIANIPSTGISPYFTENAGKALYGNTQATIYGDARGINSLDIQTRRVTANQVASGGYSTALGNGVRIEPINSVGLGTNITMLNASNSSVAVGAGAIIGSGSYNASSAVAIGDTPLAYNTTKSISSPIVIGGARANDDNCIAIGDGALAGGNATYGGYSSIVIGNNSSSNSLTDTTIGGVIVGANSSVVRDVGVAVGFNNHARDGCVAVGYQIDASLNPWIVGIGSILYSDAVASVLIGNRSQIYGVPTDITNSYRGNINIGYNNVINAQAGTGGATVIGRDITFGNSNYTANNSIAIGTGALVNNASFGITNAIAFGYQSRATQINAVAIGPGCKAYASTATAIGANVNNSTSSSVKIGANNTHVIRVSEPGAGETSLWLYDADNATLERVVVGAADSAGAGLKALAIPN